MFYGATEVT